MKRSKAYRAAAEKVDAATLYAPLAAVRLAKATSTTKYDATVEVAFRLGVDPRKADQMVRGTVNLPHGTGKTARVLVFATGDRATQAEAAGADVVGAGRLRLRCAITGGEDQDPCGLAGAVRQVDGATHHLVGLAGVDPEPEGDLDGRVVLGRRRRLGQADGGQRCVQGRGVHLLGGGAIRLAALHCCLCLLYTSPSPR